MGENKEVGVDFESVGRGVALGVFGEFRNSLVKEWTEMKDLPLGSEEWLGQKEEFEKKWKLWKDGEESKFRETVNGEFTRILLTNEFTSSGTAKEYLQKLRDIVTEGDYKAWRATSDLIFGGDSFELPTQRTAPPEIHGLWRDSFDSTRSNAGPLAEVLEKEGLLKRITAETFAVHKVLSQSSEVGLIDDPTALELQNLLSGEEDKKKIVIQEAEKVGKGLVELACGASYLKKIAEEALGKALEIKKVFSDRDQILEDFEASASGGLPAKSVFETKVVNGKPTGGAALLTTTCNSELTSV